MVGLLLCAVWGLASGVWGQSLGAYRTFHTRGYYVAPGSLDEALWRDWDARTNGRQAKLLSDATHVSVDTATGATWNTNWFFFDCDNATAQTHIRTNAGEAWFLKKSTIISRVLILQSGHNNCGESGDGLCGSNQWFLAIDKTNGQHWRRVVHGISRQTNTHGDYYLAAVDTPWPTNIGTMKILLAEVFTNKLQLPPSAPWPTFYNSQFCRTEGNVNMRIPGNWLSGNPLVTITNRQFAGGVGLPMWVNDYAYSVSDALGSVTSGDSGSPTFIVVSNRLVLVSLGITRPGLSVKSNFLADVNTATAAAGYTTNTYPVEFETLSGFPDL